MKVLRRFGNKLSQPATSPFLASNGLMWELRAGNINDPFFDPDSWFGPLSPKLVVRFFCALPIFPFISWKLGKWRGYAGFKIYGVDSENYLPWNNSEDVYPGSQALSFSLRPFSFKG